MMIEPYPIPDEFVTALSGVELSGKSNVRLIFTVPDRPSRPGEPQGKLIVAKLVVELSALADIAKALTWIDRGGALAADMHEEGAGPVH